MAIDRPWATLGIAALGVVAIALSYVAVDSVTAGTPATAEPLAVTSATKSPRPTASRPAAAVVATAGRTQAPLAIVTAQRAWSATPGACASGVKSTVATTTDGGATWTSGTSPVRRVVALEPAAGRVTVAGYDDDCLFLRTTTTDAGNAWAPVSSVGGAWTHDGPKVRTPAGKSVTPCAPAGVIAVEGSSSGAATVLCDDGAVRRTSDGGVRFAGASTVKGAIALAAGSDSTLYLVVPGGATCAGVRVRASGDDGTSWTDAGCIADPTVVAAKSVGFDVSGSTAMLLADAKTYRSVDRALTWQPRPA